MKTQVKLSLDKDSWEGEGKYDQHIIYTYKKFKIEKAVGSAAKKISVYFLSLWNLDVFKSKI